MKKTKGTGVMLFGMFAIIVIIAVFILAGNGAKKEAVDVCELFPDQQTRKIRVCRRISRDYTALLRIS